MRTARWQQPIAFLATMIVIVGGLVALMRGGQPDRYEVTARFDRAVGLYPGSSVRVLGVKIGTVRTIRPDGAKVTVVMSLPKDTPVPADATAVIIPPSLVSDRYVELTPVYPGDGPTLADGAAVAKTMTPVELDEILGSLDKLLVALGPNGANADGSLARLVDVGAKTLGKGGGKELNDTIVNLAQAVKTLADNSDDTVGVIDNLGKFTHTLAENDGRIRKLTADLATATTYLAGESSSLAQALKNLSIALGEVASLVRDHREELGSDIQTLSQVTQIVVKHKDSLTEALDVLPLGAANIAGTVNTDAKTLDIRNDNHQTGDPYSILFCQIVFPITGIPCPPAPGAKATTPNGKPAPTTQADSVTDKLSLRGLMGGRS
jgi:phospholipid/cholesterol/gamma-HCH transport system substrate-binding protein